METQEQEELLALLEGMEQAMEAGWSDARAVAPATSVPAPSDVAPEADADDEAVGVGVGAADAVEPEAARPGRALKEELSPTPDPRTPIQGLPTAAGRTGDVIATFPWGGEG